MIFQSAGYFVKQAARSLRRHFWMGTASIFTTAIALMIFGVFVVGMLNVNLVSTYVESNLEMVVWIDSNADQNTIENMGTYLQGLEQVSEVKHVSKEQGLQQLSREFGSNYDLLWSLGGENPLPDFFVVKVFNPGLVKSVAQLLINLEPVEKVDYGQEYLDNLLSLLYWVKMVGIGMVSLLGVASVFLIGNTVRLTVYARSNEISIMKYIGATNWFVRWPFLLEGMFLGAVGSFFAALFVYFGYNALVQQLVHTISFIPLLQDQQLLIWISGLLLVMGTALGMIASYVSLSRYLRF